MSALHRKLIRDVWGIRGQSMAICAVIAAGIAMLVMSLSTLASIEWSKNIFYERARFADVFAHMKRAPLAVAEQIAKLPGVSRVEPRIVFDVTLDVQDMIEPAVGRLISVPHVGQPRLNGLHLRRGRWLAPFARNEILAAEPFVESHQLAVGDSITAVINGRRQKLQIVGVVLSPEYLIQIGAGSLMPDDRRFGIFYMSYEGLAAALDMEGAFNDLSLQLMPQASEPEVLRRIDQITEPYGGIGAYGRSDQLSHQYISDEIRQLRGMGLYAPIIFLSVAAFLLNVVVSRLIATQREQIAALKALGYTRYEIGVHYVQLIAVIPIVGAMIGTLAGAKMGAGMAKMYARFYRFPIFSFQLEADVVVIGFVISIGAALLGTLAAVRRAVSLAPAEAMRPEPPLRYRPSLFEKSGFGHFFTQTNRMVIRNIERRPFKAMMSILGIAMAVAVLVLGSFMLDAVNYLMDFQFRKSQRQDLSVNFVEPSGARAVHDVTHLTGVMQHQRFRSVAARFRVGHRNQRTSIMGLTDAPLYRVLNNQEEPIAMPASGLVISRKLGELLEVEPGDRINVEILEGKRPKLSIQVAALIDDFTGLNAYAPIDRINTLMQEDDLSSGVFLRIDTKEAARIYQSLKELPRVSGVNIKTAMLASFEETMAENLLRMRSFNILFAAIIAFGVVYNNARISLAERSRELSTLRVVGFTRAEISHILLGELALLTLIALPVGMLMGYLFAASMSRGMDTEVYRIPLVIDKSTYANSSLVVIVAAAISGLIVRRRIDQLDLIAVLKSKE